MPSAEPSSDVRPVVVLVGPPGAGKSTVGRLLADRLGSTFRDTDDDIVALAGKSVSDIFLEDGEEHFRELESQAVTAALREHDGVLALGGGSVLAAANRAQLQGHRVLLLAVDVPAAAKRIGLTQHRPLVMLNPRAQLRALLDARLPLYDEVAVHTVATDELTPLAVVDAVLAILAAG